MDVLCLFPFKESFLKGFAFWYECLRRQKLLYQSDPENWIKLPVLVSFMESGNVIITRMTPVSNIYQNMKSISFDDVAYLNMMISFKD